MLPLILLQLLQLQLKKHEEETAALVVFFKNVPVPLSQGGTGGTSGTV